MSKALITLDIARRPFWTFSVREVEEILDTHSAQGITEKEAQNRLRTLGHNIIESARESSWIYILLGQFKSPLIIILMLAAAVTFFLGHYRDAIFIIAAVLINTALGFYQEFKAEKALAELKTYLKQRSRVVRVEGEREIDATEIVPGDCVRLMQGDRVPADGRLVFVNDFQVDEAILTGEALPVTKSLAPSPLSAGLADQQSMLFAGTLVTQGVGTMLVCRTGFSTELGKIAVLVAQSEREETPLQKKIKVFSLQLGVFLSLLTILIFYVGIALGHSYLDMFLTSVAIAVAAVPEGLPVAMTVILAIGVQRMARRKGVVRKLVAAEALGSTTVILTDKTGTLTQARMALGSVMPIGDTQAGEVLALALLNTNVLIENPHDNPREWRMSGRVLEMALVQSAALQGIHINKVKETFSLLQTLPFNAVNKFSASLVKERNAHRLVFFGAPEILLAHAALPEALHRQVEGQIEALAQAGELVVAVATKEVENTEDFSFFRDFKPAHITFRGLLSLRDPVRPSAKDAIRRVEEAGIRTMIMTGDHRGTAETIAREVGMKIVPGSVLDATELRTLSDKELRERLPTTRIISRVSPLDKMRIVQILQKMGEVVAMTGDGVNDAPSIKQADIGIAMGSGTEVARNVADLVLLDDNFETISAAVEEGRQIMHNIRKVLVYLLSSVADVLILIGGALVMGVALPLNALQILWVNFFSDSFPAIAFAFEKNIDGMARHASGMRSGLFNPLMKFLILFIGLSTSILLFILYWSLLKLGFPEDVVKTFIFASYGTYTLFLAFPLRSLEKSIFSYSLFSNRFLIAGVSIGVVLVGAAVYAPFLQSLFGTVPLPFSWLLGVLAVGIFNAAAVEYGKWLFRRRHAHSLHTASF